MNPSTLELEITEDAVVRDASTAIRTFTELKALGVRLAIDDFGTGYSSLSHLRRIGCDRAQGYLLGRPQRAEALDHLIEAVRMELTD